MALDGTPLGMQSAFDALASPYNPGHTPPEASTDPLTVYADRPLVYSDDPVAYYQWWDDVSEARKTEPAAR